MAEMVGKVKVTVYVTMSILTIIKLRMIGYSKAEIRKMGALEFVADTLPKKRAKC